LAYNPTTGRFAAGQKGVVGNAYNGTANSVEAVWVDFVVEVASAAGSGDDMDTSVFLMVILLKTAAQQELRPTGGASSAANHW
jgi:hypothetical protein